MLGRRPTAPVGKLVNRVICTEEEEGGGPARSHPSFLNRVLFSIQYRHMFHDSSTTIRKYTFSQQLKRKINTFQIEAAKNMKEFPILNYKYK